VSDREAIEAAIAALEQQRAVLGDVAVDAALAGLWARLAELTGASPRPAEGPAARPAAAAPGERGRPTAVAAGPAAEFDLSGERKLVTVMFADISGFTALSEKLDPEEVRAIVNDCFTACVPVVERYGGTVDKFIGDEIMALFGAPVAHENDSERALRAALDLYEAVERFASERGLSLAMHFGIETGTVVAGGLGSDRHQQYSVLGDTVNLAARLEDASSAGEILVGPHAHHLTEGLFEFEALAPLSLKGKSEPVHTFRLQRLKKAGQVRPEAGLRSPLVGRDEEFSVLREAIDRLDGGNGAVIAVAGEPGLGKSRLIAEVRSASSDRARWAEGRALSYAQGNSYSVVQSVLDALLQVPSGATPHDAAGLLASILGRLLPARAPELYPYLARLYDVPLDAESEERLRPVLPEAVRMRMHSAFVELVTVLAQERPLALVWEDLHWADPSSLSLIESLIPCTRSTPVLILLVFRPTEGRAADWFREMVASGRMAAEAVELSPLTGEQCRELMNNLLTLEQLPESLRGSILAKAEGNPFFLEELLRSLIDVGALVLDGQKVVATAPLERFDIPDTLQAVVSARVDRLPREQKRTLQDASVIGRVFQRPVLSFLVHREQPDLPLERCLGDLQDRALIRRRIAEHDYIFKHAVTHDVTYNSLLLARRKELHRLTAEAIEALFPDQKEDLCETLAYHYQKADAGREAIPYLMLAAQRARETFSNAEAIGFYGAAVELASRAAPERLSSLNEALADVLALVGRAEEAREAYGRALENVVPDDHIRRATLSRRSANTWKTARQLERAIPEFLAAEAELGPEPESADAGWVHEWLDIQFDLSWAYYWLALLEQLQALIDRVRPVVERRGSIAHRLGLVDAIVMLAWQRDRYVTSDETLWDAKRSVEYALETADGLVISHRRIVLGMCHVWRNELDDARDSIEAGIRLADKIGALEEQMVGATYLTVTERKAGNVPRVRELVAQCLALAEGKMPFYVGSAKANLCWADWKEGRIASAEENGRLAAASWAAARNPGVWLAAWPMLAIAVSEHRVHAAIGFARELLVPVVMKMPSDLEGALSEAVDAWDAGDPDGAAGVLGRSLRLAEKHLWL
jgi:class 3 adenylate cyclase